MEIIPLSLGQLFPEPKEYLPKALFQLFKEAAPHYPWTALGASLKEAIQRSVSEVPLGERLRGQIHPGAWLIGEDIVVEAGATVEAGAYVEGPAYIAAGASVRHGAYIRGYVYLGPHGVIGHTTEAKETILLEEAKAAHFAYLGNSILGSHVNLGAGTKLANLRLDHQTIKVRLGDQILDSGLKKFGAVLGDHSQTGCNSVTNPGTIFMPYSGILPCSVGTGIVDNKRGKVRK